MQIKMKNRWITTGGTIVSILLIALSLCFTPGYVARNLSEGGILERETIVTITTLRISFGIIGMLILTSTLLLLIKPNTSISTLLKKNYLIIILSIFVVFQLIMGLKPTIKSIIEWENMVRRDYNDPHALRIELH